MGVRNPCLPANPQLEVEPSNLRVLVEFCTSRLARSLREQRMIVMPRPAALHGPVDGALVRYRQYPVQSRSPLIALPQRHAASPQT